MLSYLIDGLEAKPELNDEVLSRDLQLPHEYHYVNVNMCSQLASRKLD